MRKPILTIFYQYDPWNATIGGIQSVINTLIKHAPESFELRLVGTGADPNEPVGQWHDKQFMGKPVRFFPAIRLLEDDVRHLVPTTIKYTAALVGKPHLASDFMQFHRLEPTVATFGWSGDKTLYIHNDIHQQVKAAKDTNAILWQRFPEAYFWLEGKLVAQFDEILSCNSESTELYQQLYPAMADRIITVKNAVDPEIFYPLPPAQHQAAKQEVLKELGLKPDTRLILFAGRLHPQKDPGLLIRSIAALNDPTVHLLIAGEGELKAELVNEVQRAHLENQVTFLGPVPQSKLAELHRISDVFTLSSVYEGLPIVVLEALSSGTPIVTTRCGQTPRVLTPDSGVVADDRTPKDLAVAIRQVLDNPQRFSMEACTQAVAPYHANQVVGSIFEGMLKRWQPDRF